MTLGEIIERLKKEDPNKVVPLGWDSAYSWRGIYSQLAVGPKENVSVGSMLSVLENAKGMTFYGYKGGDYLMHESVDVYLDRWGTVEGNQIGYYLLEFLLGYTPTIPEL